MYRLREIERYDLPEINKWHSDKELSKKLGGGYRFVSSSIDNAWYDRYLNSRENSVRCAIVDDNDSILGCVYLLNIDNINLSADLHIMIGKEEYRGKGVGTFAIRTMISHAFFNLNLRRIQLGVLENNIIAINLYKKVGFIEEGRKRKAIYKNGRYIDELVMGLLREEYKKINCLG